MFTSFSRRSSRVRQSYICSSCLSNVLGHPENPPLRYLADRASRSSPLYFSTHNAKAGESESKPDTDTGDCGAHELVSILGRDSNKEIRKGGRRRPARPISSSESTLAALRASLAAEDATKSSQPKTKFVATKKSRPKITSKAREANTVKASLPPNLSDSSTISRTQNSSAEEDSLEHATFPRKYARDTSDPVVSTSNDGGGKGKIARPEHALDARETAKKTKNVGKKTRTAKVDGPRDDPNLKSATNESGPSIADGENSEKQKKVSQTILHGRKAQVGKANGSTSRVSLKSKKLGGSGIGHPIKRRARRENISEVEMSGHVYPAGSNNSTISNEGLQARPGGGERRALVELIQKGKLSKADTTPLIKLLRASLIRSSSPRVKNEGTEFTSLKDALQAKSDPRISRFQSVGPDRAPRAVSKEPQRRGLRNRIRSPSETGPVKAKPGMVAPEIKTVEARDLHLVPVEIEQPPVPSLSYGLERVLFNPGVYHLQDPRSRVFNFDPYLQSIMPVSEFDFNALKQYITSSRDKSLISIAKAEKRKYTGSTSSMTSALGHFHFLLSQWRAINTGTLSQNFPVDYNTFTSLQRGPVAIFLRWRDGTYAIDADKQFDTANILSMLGKSMEKLLTLPTEDFEKYRKQNSDQISEDDRNEAESFHYTTMGDFLMRSQLDAYDPRLPGTGMFDLKTRAVVSIRMNTSQYEEGSGYEIRGRHGEWESFEREYYDMIRAAFLKYSLQVRMGRMDGIFVAFHNTERIFGFQYISLPEMDYALHGTDDTTIGDSEFKLSLDLLNRVLDRATARYPETSLRIHFETRDAPTPFMYIFAEPVEEEQIDDIQATNKLEIEEFESKVLGLAKDEVPDAEKQAQLDTQKAELDAQRAEEAKKSEWDSLQAQVEETMERDELGQESVATEGDRSLDSSDSRSDVWTEEDQRQIDEILAAAVQNDTPEDDDDEDGENGGEEEDKEEGDEEGDEEDDEDEDEDVGEECEEEIEEEAARDNDETNGTHSTGRPFLVREDSSEVSTDSSMDDQTYEAEAAGDIENTHNVERREELGSAELVENDSMLPDDTVESTEEAAAIAAATEAADIHKPAARLYADPDGPVLAMTLTIRNKVNGQYVERPENINSKDRWQVEYALAEVREPDRARSLYEMAKTRRKRALGKAKDADQQSDWNNRYIENIRKLSQKGREWRNRLDEKEKELPKKILDSKDGKTMSEKDQGLWPSNKEGERN